LSRPADVGDTKMTKIKIKDGGEQGHGRRRVDNKVEEKKE
jgi:hypothetical protein